jgi:hypothetical protein
VDLTGTDFLRSGDLNVSTVPKDNLVDISDFSILASRWNQTIDANLSTGADVTGDGLQASADFSAMQANYFMVGDPLSACPSFVQGGGLTRIVNDPSVVGNEVLLIGDGGQIARGSVAVSELPMRDAYKADINRDGIIDSEDIRAFARLNGLDLLPEFERRLDQSDGRKDRSGRSRQK